MVSVVIIQFTTMFFYGIGADYNTTRKLLGYKTINVTTISDDSFVSDMNSSMYTSTSDADNYPYLTERIAIYQAADESMDVYSTYQDVHVMMLIGFGFLMTFLKKYGFSALSYNLLITVIGLQWGMLIFNWIGTGRLFELLNDEGSKVTPVILETINLIDGDIAAAAVLISFGAVLGRASPTQLVWMTFIELIIYSLNFYICVEAFHINDVGGSIVVHTFGAYFGLAVSYVLGKPTTDKFDDCNASVYHSDLFSMIGTIFLVERCFIFSFFCFICFNLLLLLLLVVCFLD